MKLLLELTKTPFFPLVKLFASIFKYIGFLLITAGVYFTAMRLERQQNLNFIYPLVLTLSAFFFTYWLYKKTVRQIIQSRVEYEVESNQFFPTINKRVNTVEDKHIVKLLKNYGSPLFVLSHRVMKQKYDYLVNLLNKTDLKYSIAYSFKTNNISYVCRTFKDFGALAEVVSGAEYTFAKSLGYKKREIVFNGPLKDSEAITKALKEGALVNIDNTEELKTVSKIAKNKKVNIGIRVNSKKSGLNSRFGFNLENSEAINAVSFIKSQKNLNLTGIHSHIGSNIATPKPYQINTEAVCNFITQIDTEFNLKLKYLDLGGGFPVVGSGSSYSSVFAYPLESYLTAIVEPIKKYKLNYLSLVLEPGRLLIDEAALLLAKIISIRSDNNSSYVTTDASINILPLAKHRSQHVTFVPKTKGQKDKSKLDTTIYGASCIENDILAVNKKLPSVSAGDTVVFYNAGAYNITQASQFIFPRPAIVIIRNRKVKLIRKRESPSEIWRNDIL